MQSFLHQHKDKYTKSNKQVKEGQINPKQSKQIQRFKNHQKSKESIKQVLQLENAISKPILTNIKHVNLL